MFTTVKTDIPALRSKDKKNLHERKLALEKLQDPDYVPDYKFINNSQLLQMAYLDKIIEEGLVDRRRNNANSILKDTDNEIEKQRVKIDDDDLRAELGGDIRDFQDMKAFN